MNEELDPALTRWFTQSPPPLNDALFVAQLVQRLERMQRLRWVTRIAVGLSVGALIAALTPYFIQGTLAVGDWLTSNSGSADWTINIVVWTFGLPVAVLMLLRRGVFRR